MTIAPIKDFINRTKFDVCSPNSVGRVKAHERTYTHVDKIALFMLNLTFHKTVTLEW